MEDSRLVELLKSALAERKQKVAEIEEQTVKQIEEEKKRIEQEMTEDKDRQISEINAQYVGRMQSLLVEHLEKVSGKLEDLSSKFTANQQCDLQIEVPFIYGHLYSEINENSVGIMIPAFETPKENGSGYLSERMKALVFETLLKAKESLPIERVSKQSSNFTVFALDFSKLTPVEDHGLHRCYEETFNLDIMFEEAFQSDIALQNLGIKFHSSGGKVLNRLQVAQESEEDVHVARAPGYYVDKDTAIDMIFGLTKTQAGYEARHAVALERFDYEFGIGTFRDMFDNFDISTQGYSRQKIEKMLEGDTEEYQSGKDTVCGKLHFAVPVKDVHTMVRFFRLGAYTEDDVKQIYGWSDQKIRGNFADEGTDWRKKDRIRLTTRDKKKLAFYQKEDILSIVDEKE
jgi:hypothetical protein